MAFIVISRTVVLAKGHPPDTEARVLSAPQIFDGVDLPAGTAIELEARWDDERDQYGAKQLAHFTLSRAANVCGSRIPAKMVIEVRRGMPTAVAADMPASTALHIVWKTPIAFRIGTRRVPTGSTVGIECESHQLTLLVGTKPFDVDGVRVTGAAWYPAGLGGHPLFLLLAKPAEFSGVRVPERFTATFATNGHLLSLLGPATAGIKIGDRVCWTNTWGGEIRFDENARATCPNEVIDAFHCAADKPIALYDGSDAGHLARCTLTAPVQLAGRTWSAGAQLRLTPDGHPAR